VFLLLVCGASALSQSRISISGAGARADCLSLLHKDGFHPKEAKDGSIHVRFPPNVKTHWSCHNVSNFAFNSFNLQQTKHTFFFKTVSDCKLFTTYSLSGANADISLMQDCEQTQSISVLAFPNNIQPTPDTAPAYTLSITTNHNPEFPHITHFQQDAVGFGTSVTPRPVYPPKCGNNVVLHFRDSDHRAECFRSLNHTVTRDPCEFAGRGSNHNDAVSFGVLVNAEHDIAITLSNACQQATAIDVMGIKSLVDLQITSIAACERMIHYAHAIYVSAFNGEYATVSPCTPHYTDKSHSKFPGLSNNINLSMVGNYFASIRASPKETLSLAAIKVNKMQ